TTVPLGQRFGSDAKEDATRIVAGATAIRCQAAGRFPPGRLSDSRSDCPGFSAGDTDGAHALCVTRHCALPDDFHARRDGLVRYKRVAPVAVRSDTSVYTWHVGLVRYRHVAEQHARRGRGAAWRPQRLSTHTKVRRAHGRR